MINLLLIVLVVALIAYLAFWLVERIGLPHPLDMIAKAIIAIVALVSILQQTGLLSSGSVLS